MIKDELKLEMKRLGWQEDKYGHLHKVVSVMKSGQPAQRELRIKFQDRTARIEVKVRLADRSEWMKIGGAYYRDCAILDDGRVKIGGKLFGKKPSYHENS